MLAGTGEGGRGGLGRAGGFLRHHDEGKAHDCRAVIPLQLRTPHMSNQLHMFFAVSLAIQWSSARLRYIIRVLFDPGKHERLVCDTLAFISRQTRECRLNPFSVDKPMYYGYNLYTDL
jgi:hypothetical protein